MMWWCGDVVMLRCGDVAMWWKGEGVMVVKRSRNVWCVEKKYFGVALCTYVNLCVYVLKKS